MAKYSIFMSSFLHIFHEYQYFNVFFSNDNCYATSFSFILTRRFKYTICCRYNLVINYTNNVVFDSNSYFNQYFSTSHFPDS